MLDLLTGWVVGRRGLSGGQGVAPDLSIRNITDTFLELGTSLAVGTTCLSEWRFDISVSLLPSSSSCLCSNEGIPSLVLVTI